MMLTVSAAEHLGTLKRLQRAQRQTASFETLMVVWSMISAFIVDGWAILAFAVMAGLWARWAWLDWDAYRWTRAEVTALSREINGRREDGAQ